MIGASSTATHDRPLSFPGARRPLSAPALGAPAHNAPVNDIARYVAVFNHERLIAIARVHSDGHKASLNSKKAMIAAILSAARSHGMCVAGRSAAELLDSVFRVNRVVLPVAIAVHKDDRAIHVRLQPPAELAALGRECRI